jgi:UDP-N-acetylmuramate dehydrogenase
MMPALTMPSLRGELRLDEPLSRHTSWRVGGPARRLYRPADSADLVAFLQQLEPGEPLLWLGLGSNLLVRDGGFAGTVIATQGCLVEMRREGERGIRAEAGAACAKLARFAARAGLVGLEFFAGIPGTLGGALAMNAGAFGGETWRRVTRVDTLDRRGRVRVRLPEEFRIGYRQVKGPEGEWFLAAHLELETGDSEAAQAEIRRLLAQRAASQPTGQPSCGSVFRNPEGDYAARLIEAAGLKGERIGGAQVSEKHANFIINTGGASAADIEALVTRVQERVEAASGVRLQPEVRVLGEPA